MAAPCGLSHFPVLCLPDILTRRIRSSTPTPRRKPPSSISTTVRPHQSLVLDLVEPRAPGVEAVVVAAVLPVQGQVLEDASAEWTMFGARSVGADHVAVEKAAALM